MYDGVIDDDRLPLVLTRWVFLEGRHRVARRGGKQSEPPPERKAGRVGLVALAAQGACLFLGRVARHVVTREKTGSAATTFSSSAALKEFVTVKYCAGGGLTPSARNVVASPFQVHG